jgi:hypothetical protein
VLPARELHWRFSRSSGPGGQGVNTADLRVELSFDLARSLHGLAEPVPWICALTWPLSVNGVGPLERLYHRRGARHSGPRRQPGVDQEQAMTNPK